MSKIVQISEVNNYKDYYQSIGGSQPRNTLMHTRKTKWLSVG